MRLLPASQTDERAALAPQDTEEHLSRLVVEKSVFAKINRSEGVVVFKKAEDANAVLNHWATDINMLLSKMPILTSLNMSMWNSSGSCTCHTELVKFHWPIGIFFLLLEIESVVR